MSALLNLLLGGKRRRKRGGNMTQEMWKQMVARSKPGNFLAPAPKRVGSKRRTTTRKRGGFLPALGAMLPFLAPIGATVGTRLINYGLDKIGLARRRRRRLARKRA